MLLLFIFYQWRDRAHRGIPEAVSMMYNICCTIFSW
jgi:hypothetical protein